MTDNTQQLLISQNGDLKPLLLLRHDPCPAHIAQRSVDHAFTLHALAPTDSISKAFNLLEWLLYRFLVETDLAPYNAIRVIRASPTPGITLTVVLYHVC